MGISEQSQLQQYIRYGNQYNHWVVEYPKGNKYTKGKLIYQWEFKYTKGN